MSIFGMIIFQLVEWIGFDKSLLKERKHFAFDALGLAYQAKKSRHTVHEKPYARIKKLYSYHDRNKPKTSKFLRMALRTTK